MDKTSFWFISVVWYRIWLAGGIRVAGRGFLDLGGRGIVREIVERREEEEDWKRRGEGMIRHCHNGFIVLDAMLQSGELDCFMPETLLRYTVLMEKNEDGGYTVTVPLLPGCISEGSTWEEALRHIEEAIAGYIEVAGKSGKPTPVE